MRYVSRVVDKPHSADQIRRDIRAAVDALCEPGQVVELRVLNVAPRDATASGYYNQHDKLVDAALEYDGLGRGLYITLNPCTPALLSRASNRSRNVGKSDPTTADHDILRRRWLPIDFDPKRPSGIASSDEEHRLALDVAASASAWLGEREWPEPITADSGNGGHLLYRIDVPNDDESRDLIKQCLETIQQKFGNDQVKGDTVNFNAARIWRFYGTLNKKGDHTPERPHRRARIITAPTEPGVVTIEQLHALAAMRIDEPSKATPKAKGARTSATGSKKTKTAASADGTKRTTGNFDLAAWLEQHNVSVAEQKPWQDGATIYVLSVCLWNSDHTNKSAYIIHHASGAVSAGCHHEGCKDNDWHALRDIVEPGWREARAGGSTSNPSATSSDADMERMPAFFARGDHSELAGHLIKDLRGDSPEPVVFADGELYRYEKDAGLWLPKDADEEARTIIKYAGSLVASAKLPRPLTINAGDVAGTMKVAAHLVGNRRFFADAPAGIAFANGFVKWDGTRATFEKLSPAHRARVALPFSYKPNTRPKKFFRFLRQCFKGDPDIAAKIRITCEFVGACLFGVAIHYGKVLVMLGEGANGKSVLIKIMSALFPREARASIAPQMFEHEYWKAQLVGVRLNALSELPEADIMNSEAFKAIVTGDEVMGRHVKERPFKFTPIAGHVFAANRLPATTDFSHGYWRRLMVVEWNRILADHEQDATLAETLIREELPGIAAWFVRGAVRLLQRGRYDIPKCCQAAVDAWRKDADPVSDFVDEATNPASVTSGSGTSAVVPTHPWTQAMVLYTAFKIWAGRRGHLSMSIKKFGKRLRSLGIANEHIERGTFYALVLKPLPTDRSQQFTCPSCSAVWTPGMEQPA